MSYVPDVIWFSKLKEMKDMVDQLRDYVKDQINKEREKCSTIEDFKKLLEAAPDCVGRIFLMDTIRQMQETNKAQQGT